MKNKKLEYLLKLNLVFYNKKVKKFFILFYWQYKKYFLEGRVHIFFLF